MNRLDRVRQLNRQSYTEAAAAFDQSRQKLWPAVTSILESIQPGGKILDLGCGNGRLLNGLPSVNISYTGVDANEHLLAAAEKRYPQHTFIQSELPGSDLGQGQYDWITSIAFLHHLPSARERQQVLQQAADALVSGGYLVTTVWISGSDVISSSFFSHWWLKSQWNDCFLAWHHGLAQPVWRYYHAFTKTELQRLVTSAGFTIEKLETEGHNYILVARKS